MKKDLLTVAAVAALAVAAFAVSSGGETPRHPRSGDPYRAAAAEPVVLKFKSEGGMAPIARFEATIRGPGDCPVRYQIRGRTVVERTYRLTDEGFREILERLARSDFFEVESVPRSGYYADMATVTVALSIGQEHNEVTVDARRRASRDLGPVLEWFDSVRKAVTPEPVSSGD